MFVKEMQVRYRLRRVRGSRVSPPTLAAPGEAARYACALIGSEIVEEAVAICLDVRHSVVACHRLSRGTLDATVVHARDVFRSALLCNAASVMVAHNHPSGDVSPSADDAAVTAALAAAGRVMGVPLLDHVIVVADGNYFSFREAGRV